MGFYNPGSTGVLPGNAVIRDANGNAFANNFISAGTTTAASGGTVTMTAASGYLQIVTGSGGITFKLPDARTLTVGAPFTFNNNQSSGNITIQDSTGGAVATITPTGYLTVTCLSISTAAGSWDYHAALPSNATWGNTGLNYTGSLVFQTLGTTALTLDTSQKATFAGALQVGTAFYVTTNVLRVNGNAQIGWSNSSSDPSATQNAGFYNITGSFISLDSSVASNAAGSLGLTKLVGGGALSASYPMWKRNATAWDARLADDSDYAPINAQIVTSTGNYVSTSTAVQITSTNGNGYSGGLGFRVTPSGGGGPYTAGYIRAQNTNNGGANDGGALVFQTAAQDGSHTLATAMLVNYNGRVGIGTTAPGYLLDVNGTVNFSGALTGTSGTFTGTVAAGSTSALAWTSRSYMQSPADGQIALLNNAGTDFSRLQFGGTTSSFPAIKRNGAGIDIRLADDSGYTQVNTGIIKTTPVTVSALPAAATAGAGARAFVTDATATTFASIVAGSGSNGVPVYSDGTNWRIG